MTPALLALTLVLGALGAVIRYGISRWLSGRPWWALGVVNAIGSAVAGIVAGLPAGEIAAPLAVGFAGALSTFSTLALLTHDRTDGTIPATIVPRVALHVGLSVVACAAGLGLGRLLL